MKLQDFDYYLPEELIAQEPTPHRDISRLMVVPLSGAVFEHRLFKDLVEYLEPGDTLVVNDTKVIPARLHGRKNGHGAQIEVLLLKQVGGHCWEALVKPGKRIAPGDRIVFGEGCLEGRVHGNTDFGGRVIEFFSEKPFEEALSMVGVMPLPPYIKKPLLDQQRYQTIYARQAGSAAAPTAGLHFTQELMGQVKEMGVAVVPVLLHVGLGTFRPVQVEDIQQHHMHAEYFEITEEAAAVLADTKNRGKKVIAVGTTSTRCLESAAGDGGTVRPCSGWTDIFIYPGYRFKVIDGLITNFHLPKSTLLMMISALAGRERILSAYQEAVNRRYRFFSFGDAMLFI